MQPEPRETVWEIGPGLGSMTGLLADKAARVFAFEVDRGLCRFLEETLGGVTRRSRWCRGTSWRRGRRPCEIQGPPDRILGNLPYSSASLMIADIIESGLRPARMVFTVQRELADRMASAHGQKSYSSFSVLCQACFTVTEQGRPPAGQLLPGAGRGFLHRGDDAAAAGAPTGAELKALSAVARSLFASRRKTIRNNAKDRGRGRDALASRKGSTWACGRNSCRRSSCSCGSARRPYRIFISLSVACRDSRFFAAMQHIGSL